MLFEKRFSPNLHRWVFGFHAHPDFTQTMRWGGWRPTIFLEHGLAVGLFALVAAVLAAAEARCTRVRWALPSTVWLGYLALVLVLCRSTGAIALGVLLLPVAFLTSPRWQLRVAQGLAVACIVFPLLQIAGLFPDKAIVNAVRAVAGEERAASLAFRFAADVQLIDHARTKLWLGWGGWDRRMVWDPATWRYIVSDGYWIIQLGARGLVGLACVFALLLGPIFHCARRLPRLQDSPDRLRLAALALAVGAFSFDLLLNGMFVTIPFFYAGALYGVTRALTLAPQGFSVQEFPKWPEVAPRSPSSS
jgi:hypothetical protein